MSEIISIPALFKIIVDRVSAVMVDRPVGTYVHFDYGVYDVVNKNLISKEQSRTMKNMKYPLIWLVTPIQQVKPRAADYYCELPDLQILILMGTEKDISEQERESATFGPFLRPIYDELLNQIDRSCFFQVLSTEAIIHDYKEWSYGSTTDGKTHLFNDYIDAIQIKKMRLFVNETVPNKFKLLH